MRPSSIDAATFSSINHAGQVVGGFQRGSLVESFMWSAGNRMVDLCDLIDPADPLRSALAGHPTVSAINPEPGTRALMLFEGFAWAGWRRRRGILAP